MLESYEVFGFIIVDGNGALFGTLQGNTKKVIEKFSVDLPRKHGRGGQSQNRFARIRTESRHNYVREVTEAATEHFITDDKPNVKGIIFAGSADLKREVFKSELFDQRLKPLVLKILDINYGGEVGFHQAIDDSEDVLKNVKFLHERKIIGRFFEEIAKDTGKYVFGIKDTYEALLEGVIDTLIVNEDLDVWRVVLKDSEGRETVELIYPDKINEVFNSEYEIVEKRLFTEWLLDNSLFTKYVSNLEFVSDSSVEGTQFLKGFGGLGGILRYCLQFERKFEDNYDHEDSDFI